MKIKPIRKSWVKPNTYGAGEDGKVYRKTKKGWRRMAISDDGGNGYSQTKLVGKDGKRHNLDNHTAVQHAFFGGEGQVVNHNDGDKKNDSVSNLTPTTQSDNIKHAYRTGLESRKKNRKQRKMKKRNRVYEAIVNMAGGTENVRKFLQESSITDINFIHKLHEPNGNLYGYTTDEMGNQIEHSKLSKAEEYYNVSKQFISPKGMEERKQAFRDYSKLRKQLADKVAVLHDEMLGMYLTDRKAFDENGKMVKIPEKEWAENEQIEREKFNSELQSKAEQGDTLLSNGPEGLLNYYNAYSQPLEEELPQQPPVQEESVQMINEVGDTPKGQYYLTRALLRRDIATAKLKADHDANPDKTDYDELKKALTNTNLNMRRASERVSTPSMKVARSDSDIIKDNEYGKYAKSLLARFKAPMERKNMSIDEVDPYYTKGQGIYKNPYTDGKDKTKISIIRRNEYDSEGKAIGKKSESVTIGRGTRDYHTDIAKKSGKQKHMWQIGHYKQDGGNTEKGRNVLKAVSDIMKKSRLLKKWTPSMQTANYKAKDASIRKMKESEDNNQME